MSLDSLRPKGAYCRHQGVKEGKGFANILVFVCTKLHTQTFMDLLQYFYLLFSHIYISN